MGSELLRLLCALAAFVLPLVLACVIVAWKERRRKSGPSAKRAQRRAA